MQICTFQMGTYRSSDRRLFDRRRPQISYGFKCVLQRKSLFVQVEECVAFCVCVCVCVFVWSPLRVPSVDTEGLSCSPLWRWLGNSSRQPLGFASPSFISCLCLYVCVCVCVCVRERASTSATERVCVCVCEQARTSLCLGLPLNLPRLD